MVMLLPFPVFFFAIAFLLFCWDELYGLAYLLAGYSLFNRNFAYIHVTIGSFPLYITEFCLILWSIRIGLCRRKELLRAWSVTPSLFHAFWITFLLLGLFSIYRGLKEYPAIQVFRDFAIVYYSLGILLASASKISQERLNRLFQWVGLSVFIHSLVCLYINFSPWPIPESLEIFHGQGAGGSMMISLALLFVLARVNLQMNSFTLIVWSTILTSELLVETVRSAWTGYIVGLFCLLLLMMYQLTYKQLLVRAVQNILFLGALPVLCVFSLSAYKTHMTVKHLAVPSVTALPSHAVPSTKMEPPPSSHTPDMSHRLAAKIAHIMTPQPLKNDLPPDPTLETNRKRKSFNAWSNILFRINSFSLGSASVNVQTRFWLWRDAVSEVFGIGLYSPHLSHNDLKKYSLPKYVFESKKLDIPVWPAALTGLENKPSFLHLEDKHSPKRWSTRSRWITVLTGIPFGKLFLPPEIIYCVISPHRYEPHNSLVDVLYRLGSLGLFCFLGLVAVTFYFGWKSLSSKQLNPILASWMAGAMGGLAYHLIHSLTDNTLENAFKGLIFWVLIGFIYATYAFANDH